jgi:hypothetical protein
VVDFFVWTVYNPPDLDTLHSRNANELLILSPGKLGFRFWRRYNSLCSSSHVAEASTNFWLRLRDKLEFRIWKIILQNKYIYIKRNIFWDATSYSLVKMFADVSEERTSSSE